MPRRSLIFKLIVCALLLYIASGAYSQWELLTLWDIPATNDGPIEFNGIPYDNSSDVNVAIAEADIGKQYPWAKVLNYYWQAIGLVAAACGAGGGFLRELFYSVTQPSKKNPNWMLLGFFMGPTIILCISGIREILIESGTYRVWSISALAFLSGCFSEESFTYLKKIYEKMGKEILK